MEQTLNDFISGPWWGVISTVVTLASMVAAITPGTTDNTVVKLVKSFADVLALNFGRAKEKVK
jgi:hypothetical protein